MPKKAKPLTDRDIERLKTDDRQLRIGAGGVPGLMVVVNERGDRQFFATYRILGDARTHWLPIGQWVKPVPDPSDPSRWLGYGVEDARRDAAEARRLAKLGVDPRSLRANAAGRLKWEGLINGYLTHARADLKPRTVKWVEALVDRHIAGAFPGWFAADVRRPELISLHARIKSGETGQAADIRKVATLRAEGKTKQADRLARSTKKLVPAPVAADRCMALIRKAFALALAREQVPENPASGLSIEKTVVVRKRFLDAPDLSALGAALEQESSWQAVALVKLLLTTGLRLSEVVTLRWDEIDAERQTITKASHKTSRSSGDLVQPLSEAALQVLGTLYQNKLSPWVLPGDDASKPYSGAQKAWQRIRRAADLEDVHLHDLRRTFASWGSLTGQEIGTVSKLLNHSSIGITAKVYAQVDQSVRAKAADAIASGITAALGGGK